MINNMKLNWRYIFVKSNKIAVLVFSLIEFVNLITPTCEILNFICNFFLRILTAALILATIYLIIVFCVSININKTKKVELFKLHSNHTLYIEYGDLFECGEPNERKNIAFAGNRCFDTVVDDDLVGSSKIHGIALKRIYENGDRNKDTVNEEIKKSLKINEYKNEKLNEKDKRSGNLFRYEVGAVAEIKGIQNEKYFILGLTSFDNKLRAHVDKNDYINAISSLIKYISERSQGFPTYMPVIGAGGSDVGTVNDLIVFIIKIIEMYKDEIDCDIHIVINDKDEKQGLLNLKMI